MALAECRHSRQPTHGPARCVRTRWRRALSQLALARRTSSAGPRAAEGQRRRPGDDVAAAEVRPDSIREPATRPRPTSSGSHRDSHQRTPPFASLTYIPAASPVSAAAVQVMLKARARFVTGSHRKRAGNGGGSCADDREGSGAASVDHGEGDLDAVPCARQVTASECRGRVDGDDAAERATRCSPAHPGSASGWRSMSPRPKDAGAPCSSKGSPCDLVVVGTGCRSCWWSWVWCSSCIGRCWRCWRAPRWLMLPPH